MKDSYSYYKRGVFETCPRQYFYEYYASDKRVPFDASRKKLIRELKQLSNCDMVAGDILHRLIKTYLTKGKGWSNRWYLTKAKEWFDEQLNHSRHLGNSPQSSSEKYQPKILVEFYYNDPEAEKYAFSARQKLVKAMDNFLNSDQIQEIVSSSSERTLDTEKKITGLKLAGFTIDGKIDAISVDSSGIKILDWKMGQMEGELDSLQLFIYGWWASEKFSVESSLIRVQRVFLGDAFIEKEKVLEKHLLQRGKARLIQDIELMKEMDIYGRTGNEGAFSPCNLINVCRRCKYQQICHEETSPQNSRPISASLRGLLATL